ncbi:PREDICTED: nuclear pore complex protein Nup50 [Wasmannia auropunctata]|uniref:nuclear pore complex protein Nup50 n=1 Tax=Wasmannia auropunctata TaxID=64793 RepID=UPI0005EFA3AB|nr:PREDICTED: nuclear pore complex protein Nup50 [Wasmannia auropunctata]XP_011693727.1 PREDICTED: nuclear pore complex protein Nup50 [Wasmannia auropunctata]XP_011693729.1 PREDICTED: nuclear pore complex protein Nup50 [Wasmannia auropunctata]
MAEMSKRTATTELNHDNWNEENEPEEAGTFVLASNDQIEKRVIKTARRRLPSKDGSSTKSAFGTFTGFKTTPLPSLSPFSFLASVSTTSSTTTSTTSATTVNTSSKQIASNGAPKSPETNADKKEEVAKLQTTSSTSASKKISVEQGAEKTKNHSSDYYAKLKGLNESVATWIKSHVDANPFCILTPIFKDYEKYLKEITSKEESTKAQTSHTSAAQNDSKQDTSSEKKTEKSAYGSLNTIKSMQSTKPPLTAGTEWKPEKSIFSNITANTTSVFSNAAEQKAESSKSVFGNTDNVTADKGRSIFGNVESTVASKNIFGSTESNPFLHKPTVSDSGNTDEEEAKSNAKSVAPTFPTFSFGQSSTASNVTAGFSFGSAKPFSFAPQAVKPQESEDKTDNENKDEEDEEPPKPDFKPVAEEGTIYEQRCKVFVKKDNNFSDRGIGMLYLKPTPTGKTQLIVRADTTLGNLLLNTLLTQSIPTKRMNKNTIMLVCLPMPDSSPPPVAVLLRVKTSEDADELLEALNKHKK